MREHPCIGERIVASIEGSATSLAPSGPSTSAGTGPATPDGLRGEAIPLASRIVLACEAYHAMRVIDRTAAP